MKAILLTSSFTLATAASLLAGVPNVSTTQNATQATGEQNSSVTAENSSVVETAKGPANPAPTVQPRRKGAQKDERLPGEANDQAKLDTVFDRFASANSRNAIPLSKVPADVVKAAEKDAAGGKIVRWEKEGNRYKAVIEKGGKQSDFSYHASGKTLSEQDKSKEKTEKNEKH